MLPLITVFIAIVSILLILVVLVQNPKGGGLDSTFGAGANQMFGAAKSADFIEKATWYLVAALFILCIVAALLAGTGAAVDPGTNIQFPSQQ